MVEGTVLTERGAGAAGWSQRKVHIEVIEIEGCVCAGSFFAAFHH